MLEIAASRHLDFRYLQKTGWKGEGAKNLGGYN